MSEPRLVLASQSPRRRELLHLLGLPFEVTVADVAQIPRADETPVELVLRLSRAKAESADIDVPALGNRRELLVVACDTIVVVEDRPNEDRVLGKPRDPQEAMAMLRLLRGRAHVVYSAVTVRDGSCRISTELAKTRLSMRTYSESELAAYVTSGDPMDKAGAYAIQHQGFDPVETIEGCYASVMGLPLCHVTYRLRHWGYNPPADVPTSCQEHTGHRCTVYQEILDA